MLLACVLLALTLSAALILLIAMPLAVLRFNVERAKKPYDRRMQRLLKSLQNLREMRPDL